MRARQLALVGLCALIGSAGLCGGRTNTDVTTLDLDCKPDSILSTEMSTVTATVATNNVRAIGRTVNFSASDCGGMNPPSNPTSSGNPDPATGDAGVAKSSFTGSALTTCVATITATAASSGVSKTCMVTVTPLPITVPATSNGLPPTPGVTASTTVTITPDVTSPKNPFIATYSIAAMPKSAGIISVSVTVDKASNISTGHTSSPTPDPNGATSVTFIETTKSFDTETVKIVSDGGTAGGTATFDVALADGTGHAIHAIFKASSALPGPK